MQVSLALRSRKSRTSEETHNYHATKLQNPTVTSKFHWQAIHPP